MTIAADAASRWEYEGDGTTDIFGFDGPIFAAANIKAYADGALGVLGVDYTITLNSDTTGSVVFAVPPPAPAVPGEKNVVLVRDVPASQEKTWPRLSPFPAESVAQAFDKLTVLMQQAQALIARRIGVSDTDPLQEFNLPAAEERAGKALLFDDNGELTVGAMTLLSIGLGTLALQNSDAVGISGGAINGVALAGCTFEGQVNDVILGGTIDANGQPIIDALLNDPIIESGEVQTVLVLPGGGSVTSDGIGVGVSAQPGLSFYGSKTAANNTLTIETITSGEAKVEVLAQGAVQGDMVTERSTNGLSLRNRSNGPLGLHTNDARRVNIDNAGRVNVGNVDNAYGAQLEVMLAGAPNCLALGRFSNDSSRARMVILKSRGASVGAHGLVQAGDPLGELAFAGSTGAAYAFGASITVEAEGTPGASSMGARMRFALTPDGSTSAVEFLRANNSGALIHRNNATTIFTAASHLGLRSYTVATLPAAAAAGEVIRVSDGTGNKRLAISDAAGAANWRFPDGNLVS